MRLLYFAAHQMWPLTSGNRLRDYHLARELAKRASVTFVEMCHRGEEPSNPPNDCAFEEVVSLKKRTSFTPGNVLRGLVGPSPFAVLNYLDSKSANQLATLLSRGRFDTVQIEGIHLSGYLDVIKAAPSHPSIVVDWHNIESELMWRYSKNAKFWPRRAIARRTATLLKRSEMMLLEGGETHTVVSDREQQKLLNWCPSARVNVIPNGVDTNFFSASLISNMQNNAKSGAPKPSILYVGAMDYHANIDGVTWFAREIWPEIAAKHPDLEFVIVGRRPSAAVRALASQRIRVTGTVDDVRPFYASAVVVVAPLRVGGGTRLKILEAMAAGVPVVSTRLGAEGIEATPNLHLLLAENRAEMLAAIDQMTDPQKRSRLVSAAREFVTNRCDWRFVGEKLYQIHSQLLSTSSCV